MRKRRAPLNTRQSFVNGGNGGGGGGSSSRQSSILPSPTPREWIPDHQRPNCVSCHRQFSLLRRCHHCRACGEVFCDACSSNRMCIPGLTTQRVRVCDSCCNILNSSASTTGVSGGAVAAAGGGVMDDGVDYDYANDSGEGGASEESPRRTTHSQFTYNAQDASLSKTRLVGGLVWFVLCVVVSVLLEPVVSFMLARSCSAAGEFCSVVTSMIVCVPCFMMWWWACLWPSKVISWMMCSASDMVSQPRQVQQQQSNKRPKKLSNDARPTSNKKQKKLTSEEREWVQLGTDAINTCYSYVKELQRGEGGWQLNRSEGSGDTLIEVYKRKSLFDKGRKAFVTRALIPAKPKNLHELFMDHKNTPKWNTQILDYKLLRQVTDNVAVLDCIAAPAAGGAVSSRDFLDVRVNRVEDGDYLLGGQSVKLDSCPPLSTSIRGDNAPGGWICVSVPDRPDWTYFYWIMDTNLKGWLPTYLIEATIGSTQVDFVHMLRKLARERNL